MARLVEAVPPAARLILLGDMDQLASVEAGAVLGDICNTGGISRHSRAFAAHVASSLGQTIPVDDSAPAERGLWDCIVHLQQSHRYAPDSDIGALVRAINRGDADRALQILAQPDSAVSLIEGASPQAAAAAVAAVAADGFSPFLAAATPLARLARLEEFRILCVHRRGPLGVETLNREVERLLEQRGQLQTGSGRHYPGRPLIVTENDYQLELFNGDVGVIAEATDGRPMAFFAASGGVRSVPPSRLPAHETVFAMTVHKAQGSELATVAVALPSEISPLLSRELLYTAVSRAQSRVLIYGRREILRHAIETRIERASGLRERLWETGC
jgi:exodeoxyribonuclease V alpha subunit